MPDSRKRPCMICRRWFRPDPRVGDRQRACGKPECQTARRQKIQASWRKLNPGYAISWRMDRRKTQAEPPEPLRLPAPLNQLPWDVAKDQIRPYLLDPTGVPNILPLSGQKTRSDFPHTQLQPDNDATGVSPTGPEVGASASARAAPPAPSAGVAG